MYPVRQYLTVNEKLKIFYENQKPTGITYKVDSKRLQLAGRKYIFFSDEDQ